MTHNEFVNLEKNIIKTTNDARRDEEFFTNAMAEVSKAIKEAEGSDFAKDDGLQHTFEIPELDIHFGDTRKLPKLDPKNSAKNALEENKAAKDALVKKDSVRNNSVRNGAAENASVKRDINNLKTEVNKSRENELIKKNTEENKLKENNLKENRLEDKSAGDDAMLSMAIVNSGKNAVSDKLDDVISDRSIKF